MRKFVKVLFVLGACVLLAGCPEVKSVQGDVQIPKVRGGGGALFVSAYGPAKVGDTVKVGDQVRVAPGGSITIAFDHCDLTYTSTFTVVEPKTCDRNDEEKQQEQQQAQQQQPEQQQSGQSQQGGGQQQQSQGQGQGQGLGQAGTGQPGYAQGGGGGGGGGGGIGGPPVIATGVPTYTRIMQVVSNPILTNTLAVIGAVSVAKEIHDKTNGNGGDEPISK